MFGIILLCYHFFLAQNEVNPFHLGSLPYCISVAMLNNMQLLPTLSYLYNKIFSGFRSTVGQNFRFPIDLLFVITTVIVIVSFEIYVSIVSVWNWSWNIVDIDINISLTG